MINITPQGKQAEVFALPAKGHLVVLGTAGSGKTTIALLRAYHLANLDNNKVLLVTFNAALVQYMKDICGTVPDNLTIENIINLHVVTLTAEEKCLIVMGFYHIIVN